MTSHGEEILNHFSNNDFDDFVQEGRGSSSQAVLSRSWSTMDPARAVGSVELES